MQATQLGGMGLRLCPAAAQPECHVQSRGEVRENVQHKDVEETTGTPAQLTVMLGVWTQQACAQAEATEATERDCWMSLPRLPGAQSPTALLQGRLQATWLCERAALGPMEDMGRTPIWVSARGALYPRLTHKKPASCPGPRAQALFWRLHVGTQEAALLCSPTRTG